MGENLNTKDLYPLLAGYLNEMRFWASLFSRDPCFSSGVRASHIPLTVQKKKH